MKTLGGKLGAGVLVIVVLLLAATYVIGTMAESKAEEQLALLQEKFPQMKVELDSYNRGFFSSHFVYKYSFVQMMPVENAEEEGTLEPREVSFLAAGTFYHGPIPWRQPHSASVFMPVAGVAHLEAVEFFGIAEAEGFLEPIMEAVDASGVVWLDGSSTFYSTMEPMELNVPSQNGRLELSLRAMEFVMNVSANAEDFSGSMDWGGLSAPMESPAGGKTDMGPITSQFDYTVLSGGLFVGDMAIRLEQLKTSGTPKDVILHNLEYLISATESGAKYDLDVDVLLEKIGVGDGTYGPAALRLKLDGLETSALLDMQQDMNAFQTGGQASPEEFLKVFESAATDILRGKPKFHIEELAVTTPTGKLLANATATVDGANLPQGVPLEAMGPALVGALDVQGSLNVGRELALEIASSLLAKQFTGLGMPPEDAQAQAMAVAQGNLDGFVQAGFINTNEGELSADINFGGGALTINGKPLPF